MESPLRSDSTGTATAKLLCAPRLCPVSPNLPTGVGRTPQNKGETLIPKTPKIEKKSPAAGFFPDFFRFGTPPRRGRSTQAEEKKWIQYFKVTSNIYQKNHF
ncbi:MAG: hypothetical protein AAF960_22895 [Bacteroidota bacterium]